MIFPEHLPGPEGHDRRPYALIKLIGPAALDKFKTRLAESYDLASLHEDKNDAMIGVEGKPGGDINNFVREIDGFVGRYNAEGVGQGPAEIVETRLVDGKRWGAELILQLTPGLSVSFYDRNVAPKDRARWHMVLDPGRVFGTGEHPSTGLAALAVEELFSEARHGLRKVLDVGCGSGILSLAAAGYGADYVLGIDISPEAVAISRRNVLLNGLAGRVWISGTPLAGIKERFDLIVANVTPSVLKMVAKYLPGRLRAGGFLVVSGFQARQTDDLRNMLQRQGFKFTTRYEKGSWQAMRCKLAE